MICKLKSCELKKECNVELLVEKKMQQPVYAYLELTNFYQSHKRFVNSLPKHQLWYDENNDKCVNKTVELERCL